jgi:hypothetical protein
MIQVKNVSRVIAAVLAVGLAGSAQAVSFFQIDPNPGGAKLNLTGAKDTLSSVGSVINYGDVATLGNANVDYAHGYANITPVAGSELTSLLFTPVDPHAFNGFSFRGQAHVDNTILNIMVKDHQGHAAETFSFTIPEAHQSFGRIGIFSSIPGESIEWVQIFSGPGFELHDIDHIDFNIGNGADAIPEPASWAMMVAGFGIVGAAMRRRKVTTVSA